MNTFNEQTMKGKWKEIKGEIRKAWGNITGDELEQTKGDLESISGLVQQKYGIKKEEATTRLNGIYDSFTKSAGEIADKAKHEAAAVTENVKNKLDSKV